MQSFTHVFKKALFITVLCTLSFTATTHAYSLTDAKKQIQSLTAEIVSLKKQLGALALTATNQKITADATPIVTVVSPNGRETFKAGDIVTIKWTTSSTLAQNTVSIGLHYYANTTIPQNTEIAIANAVSNSGSYTWRIPTSLQVSCEAGICTLPFGTGYKIGVFANTNSNRYTDESDAFFTIQAPTSCGSTIPSVTVVSPNGGEFFKPGSTLPIQWSTCNIAPSASMAVDLVSKNTAGTTITFPLLTATANDGSESVTLPTTATWAPMLYGNNFKIVVRQRVFLGAQAYQDDSNQTFTIAPLAVDVVMGTPSYNRTTNTSGQVTSVTYGIPLKVSPLGQTVYLKQLTQLANSVSGSSSFAFVFQNSSAPLVSDVTSSAVYTLSSSDAPEMAQGFRLNDGTTNHFTLTVTLLSPNVANSSYRVALKQLQVFSSTTMLAQESFKVNLLPVENYRTDYQLINN